MQMAFMPALQSQTTTLKSISLDTGLLTKKLLSSAIRKPDTTATAILYREQFTKSEGGMMIVRFTQGPGLTGMPERYILKVGIRPGGLIFLL